MNCNKIRSNMFFLFIISCFLLCGITFPPSIRMQGISESNNQKSSYTKLSDINPLYIYDWHEVWGYSENDLGEFVALDSLENIFVAGSSRRSSGYFDFFLLKFNSSGGLLWERFWGGGKDDMCESMVIDSLDNIYLAGYTASFGVAPFDACVVKYNNSGDLQWDEIWDGGNDDIGSAIALDSNDDIFLVGYKRNPSPTYDLQFLLIKYNKDGYYEWHQTWGDDNDDLLDAIVIDASDNMYIAGTTYLKTSAYGDIILFKCNSTGGISWSKTWGGSDSERPYTINLDSLNNIYIGGYSESYGSDWRNWVILKYTNEGSFLWSEYKNGHSECKDICIDSSDGIYATGFAQSNNFTLVKYSSSGNEELNFTWGSESESCYSVVVDSWSNIYLTGNTNGFGALMVDNCLARFLIDSDADNLGDQDEVTIYFTDPNNNDSDGDGLLDGEEVSTYNTDPNDDDTDLDGMTDGWEINYFLDPLVNDAMLDPDEDSLTNIQEFLLNTNPRNPDTDSDGHNDGEEVENNTDPLDPNSPPPLIDGYNIMFMVTAVSICAFLLIWKRRKHL